MLRSGKDAYLIPLVLAAALSLAAQGAGAPPVCAQSTSISLNWTAPGNDGNSGVATRYDIRYSTAPITDANFSLAWQVPGVPSPAPAGTRQSVRVSDLLDSAVYYFALKTADANGNWSPMSNVAVWTGPQANPGPPLENTLPLTFSAPRPNPTNGLTRLMLDLPQPAQVWIEVLDVLGRRVRLLADEIRPSGHNEFDWDVSDGGALPPGVYLVRAKVMGEVFLRRLAIVR